MDSLVKLLIGASYLIATLTVSYVAFVIAIWLFNIIPHKLELKRLRSLLESASTNTDRDNLFRQIEQLHRKYRIRIFKDDHSGYMLLLLTLLFVVSLGLLIVKFNPHLIPYPLEYY